MRRGYGYMLANISAGLLIGLSGAVSAQAADFVFDVNNSAQPVLGFGAQVWAGNTTGQSVLADLNMSFARVQSGVNWFTFPTQPPTDTNSTAGDNFTDMYNHIAANFNGPNNSERWHLPSIKSTYNHAQANGIDLVLNEFQIAHSFLNSSNTRMITSNVDDYATFLAAQVQYLNDQGVYPAYIEMANEPNGTWNGLITPSQYNTLVQQTRAQLDAHGFTDVGIIGPGLNEIGGTRYWNGYQVADWVNTLDTNGINSLAGWSAHTWDDWAGLAGQVQAFNNTIAAADPGGNKPVFITEYATSVSTYGGVDYGSPDGGGSAAEQSGFAVRTFDNTITLLNGGASTLILWEAADQAWSDANWGLRRLDGTVRPSFEAFEALLTELPDGAVALDGLGSDGNVNAAAVTDGAQLIIAMANNSDQTRQRVLQIDNTSDLALDRAVQFVNSTATDIVVNLTGNTLTVNMPAQSTLTLIFDLSGLIGDLDGDGFVGIGDLNLVLGNWNTIVSPGDLLQGDPDGDGFVGIGDLNLVLGNWNASTPPSTPNTIPEPASLWILTAGGMGLAGIRRRRRRT
jgi:O-glycosyl hydrolase